jgi:hypothetical protein
MILDNQYDELELTIDPIPKNAISFDEAYDELVTAMESSSIPPRFNEYWSKVLQKSRELETTVGHDPESSGPGWGAYWQQRKWANLSLRLALEEKKLIACTQDPHTGQVRQLPSDVWIPQTWKECLDADTIPDDLAIPPPSDAWIDGWDCRIFFVQTEFQAWLSREFGISNAAIAIAGKRRRDAVIEAILALWGPQGPPAGIAWTKRNEQINTWLDRNDRQTVSTSTIQLALKDLLQRK